MRRGAKVVVSWGSALVLILCLVPSALISQGSAKGNLIGFVFEKDGSTPVAGAVVVVKNVSTGAVTEGKVSDELGVFRFSGLDAGLYALGVRSDKGNYNSQDFFGVTPEKTAKISIALKPYDPAAASAAEAVIKDQRDKGEAFIGKVLRYLPETKEAEVLVEIGLVQHEDRIHIKGVVTDFYQDMRTLKAYGAKAERVLSGHPAVFKTSSPCEPGDFVYIVCKRGVPPFFLAPLGVAAIVAGAVPLSATYEEDISQYRIKD
jgi:hypothetical protein